MPYKLNQKICDLMPYDPITGKFQIRLDANESFLPVPEGMDAELRDAAAQIDYRRYPDPMAAELCKSFAAHYGVDAANVTAGNGSDELISVLCSAFLIKGEKVLVTKPDFSMYSFYASISEAEPVVYQKPASHAIDPDEIIRLACDNQVRMILFSNPCNPTGVGLHRDALHKIITSVSALVVLDEAYMDFWDQSLLTKVNNYDNLIILRTCSKAFGMAAIRLGFAVANPTLTRVMRAVKSPYNVNAFTQAAGVAILSRTEESKNAISKIIQSKNELFQAIRELEKEYPSCLHVRESCTNFLFVQVTNAKQVYESLLKRGIAVRLMGDYLRITAGNQEENRILCRNLKEILVETPQI